MTLTRGTPPCTPHMEVPPPGHIPIYISNFTLKLQLQSQPDTNEQPEHSRCEVGLMAVTGQQIFTNSVILLLLNMIFMKH